jgi:hypothetical protein
MTSPPERPAAASPQGAPLADRQSRIRGASLTSGPGGLAKEFLR